MKRFLKSVGYALVGIKDAFAKGGNIRIHVCIATLTIVLGLLLNISMNEWCIIFICVGVVISAEIMNTAIEEFVDKISLEITESSRRIKDLAAGGVLVLAIASALVGCVIFVPKIMNLLSN